jgi:2-(1,2-epoxy-1,2-dihydrophenyl)acetyl-CoA isomerase
MKANLNDGETLPLDQLLDAEAERFYVNAATDDAGEAARAFMEKRPPRFKGA